ncbi:MAG: fructose-bisphosphatase class II family protein [Planctomycetes bacterium]|nr:fructose-bisphosphatase class II family protein [Planctomycetota bacterium]
MENNFTFIRDEKFVAKMLYDPYIYEAHIPEEYNLKTCGNNLQLENRNELRHPVGIVAARSLKYFSNNGEEFNIFRTRSMAVWWLRHIYNSFSWWQAYVVNAEGERKDMPMLYIGERFGSLTGYKGEKADIALSAFENDRCLVNPDSEGGAIFAVGYSNRGVLFNSPDMYGTKTVVGKKYKGAGVSADQPVTKNLTLMAKHTLKNRDEEPTRENILAEIRKMKILTLDRSRHRTLAKAVSSMGATVILVKDDDLTPTFAAVRDEIDLIVGVGGVPEAVLGGIIVEHLGGEMTLRILPSNVALDEGLVIKRKNWDSFKKNEIDTLRDFKIVRPGMEKYGEIPWNKIQTAKDLVKGESAVFTAAIIKNNTWIHFPDGEDVPGVTINSETGDVKVYVVRITCNNMEIIPIIYKTTIGKCRKEYELAEQADEKAVPHLLLQLGKAYTEFGLFEEARDCVQKAKNQVPPTDNFYLKCRSVYEYVSGLEFLTKASIQTPKEIIEHFAMSDSLDIEEKGALRDRKIFKRFYEFLGDKNSHAEKYNDALGCYREALRYRPHELKLHRKVNSIEMKNIIAEYFHRIDQIYRDSNYEESGDWNCQKLVTALEVFYSKPEPVIFSCSNPWLIFFRRTVLHGETPSQKLAILIKLLRLCKKLRRANDKELSVFMTNEFQIAPDEAEIILQHRQGNAKFGSVEELYLVKGLNCDCLTKLLFPHVKVASRNEIDDSEIPLSISLVEAMEQRYKNILEELKEGHKDEAQEHSYAVAEAYHYVGLALYDTGDWEGSKIYYTQAINRFQEIIDKFEGITPVNAQYRIGNLYEELAILFEGEQNAYYDMAKEAYWCIIDEKTSIELFGSIRDLTYLRIEQAKDQVKGIEKDLHGEQ